MPALLIASLQPGEGRTAVTAALGAALAGAERPVQLARIRSDEGGDPAAEDDAGTLAAVPACDSPGRAVTEQDALALAAEAGSVLRLIEAPPGVSQELPARMSAQVILVSDRADESRLEEEAAAAQQLGDALLGVIVTRQTQKRLDAVRADVEARGLACLGVVPEDRLLAGPSVRELAEALHASRLVENGEEDEALEYVMLGPLSSDPGQPYFLQHGSKAVVQRFDKMDLHLAALATEPECLILTGGQQPSPYLLDRVSDLEITVLLAPDGTEAVMTAVDGLYPRTRFAGGRKLTRAIELFQQHTDIEKIRSALR